MISQEDQLFLTVAFIQRIENISAFLDHQFKPISKQVKSCIKYTNDFLKKLRDLSDLPEHSMICTIESLITIASQMKKV